MRDVTRDFAHGQHVHVGGLAALLAVLARDGRTAVEAGAGLEFGGQQVMARFQHTAHAAYPRTETLRGLGTKCGRLVLEVVVERGRILDAVADHPPLWLAGRCLR
jgi:hypothetical protein